MNTPIWRAERIPGRTAFTDGYGRIWLTLPGPRPTLAQLAEGFGRAMWAHANEGQTRT